MRAVLATLGFLATVQPWVCYAEPICPTHTQNYHECALYRESAILQAHPRLFVRKDGSLTVRLLNGKALHFQDVPADSEGQNADDVVGYAVVKYFSDIKYALISLAYWEGNSYCLLNVANGAKTPVGGDAILSPDKRRIAVWNMDIEAGYSPNILGVYRISNKEPIQEFLVKPNDWGAEAVAWKNSKTLEFSKTYWSNDGFQTQTHSLRFNGKNLNLGGTWQID